MNKKCEKQKKDFGGAFGWLHGDSGSTRPDTNYQRHATAAFLQSDD